MDSDGQAAGDRELGAARPRSHLFAVRLRKEPVEGRSEYRSGVRDVLSGASCSFLDWSDLVAFLMACLEEADPGKQ